MKVHYEWEPKDIERIITVQGANNRLYSVVRTNMTDGRGILSRLVDVDGWLIDEWRNYTDMADYLTREKYKFWSGDN